MKFFVELDGTHYTVEIERPDQVTVDGEPHQVDFQCIPCGEVLDITRGALYSLIMDGYSHEVFVEWHDGVYEVMVEGERHLVRVEDERLRVLAGLGGPVVEATGEVAITAPMPGLVVKVPVEVGESVKAGQAVVILEAMKMENQIRSPREGRVKAVRVTAGQAVEQGQVLAVIE